LNTHWSELRGHHDTPRVPFGMIVRRAWTSRTVSDCAAVETRTCESAGATFFSNLELTQRSNSRVFMYLGCGGHLGHLSSLEPSVRGSGVENTLALRGPEEAEGGPEMSGLRLICNGRVLRVLRRLAVI
jgi:hypothetical protein